VNPVYWFVRGLHTRNMASFFQASGYDDKANSFLLEKNRHYQIAMKLDKNNEPHLSASAYAVMKSGLPESLKQQAIEAELNLGGSGESDTYYWYLHWSNVNELQKQGRFDEADVALQRMKNELAETGQKNTFDKLVKKIEKELKIKKAISENKKIVKKSPPKKAQQSARDHEAFTEEKVKEQYYRNLAVILIVMVVLAVIIFMFELKRRKRK
ncbi:MAG: hypothetical protein KAU21_21380, partial [Gammaproteobacteria bacterium]|nr:hypothetical protein [Gammaproteobacteria bacterium]